MSCHELENSTVTQFYRHDDSVILELLVETDGQNKYRISVSKAKLMQCDITSLNDIAMVFDDGEIIHMVCKDQEFEVIIEWNKFSEPRSQITKSYKFTAENVSVNGV